MRSVLNRLAVVVLLVALLALAVGVAIEAAARLAGAGAQLGPLDYRSWWTSVVEWGPSRAVTLAVLIGAAVGGLLILVAELRPVRREPLVEVGSTAHGPVLLRVRSVRPYLRGRLAEEDYVRASSPRVRVRGTAATVRDRPSTTRPYDKTELAATHTAVTQDLRRLGLEPLTVEIDPRAPGGRDTRRVR